MALKQRERDLHEYLPDKVLIDLEPSFLAFLNQLRQVSALAIFHNDIQSSVRLVYELVHATHNVFVL